MKAASRKNIIPGCASIVMRQRERERETEREGESVVLEPCVGCVCSSAYPRNSECDSY